MKERIYHVLNTPGTPYFRFVQTSLALVTLVSLIASVGEGIEYGSSYTKILISIEWIVVLIFTCEYLLRLWVAPRKRAYCLSTEGLLDLIAILPMYVGMGNFTFLRLARFIRGTRAFRALTFVNMSHIRRTGHEVSEKVGISIWTFMAFFLVVAFGFTVWFAVVYFESVNAPVSVGQLFTILAFFSGQLLVPETMGSAGATTFVVAKVLILLVCGVCIGVGFRVIFAWYQLHVTNVRRAKNAVEDRV